MTYRAIPMEGFKQMDVIVTHADGIVEEFSEVEQSRSCFDQFHIPGMYGVWYGGPHGLDNAAVDLMFFERKCARSECHTAFKGL